MYQQKRKRILDAAKLVKDQQMIQRNHFKRRKPYTGIEET